MLPNQNLTQLSQTTAALSQLTPTKFHDKTPPVDLVCLGCKRTTERAAFKQTPFGDWLCARCYEVDATCNPDIYGDPLARQEIWQSVVESVKHTVEPFKKLNVKQAINYADAHNIDSCTICDRKPSDRNRHVAWVKLHDVDGIVCRYCFTRAQSVVQDAYYLDAHGRCFQVTDKLKALYVFGSRKLPQLFISEGASKVLWDVQREHMVAIAEGYTELTIALVDEFYRRHKHADYDKLYDIGINTLLITSTLHNPELGEFVVYLSETLKREMRRSLKRTAIKQSNAAKLNSQFVPLDSVEYELESGLEDYLKLQYRLDTEDDLIKFQQICRQKVGEENWYLFTSWLYLNRTQAELGRAIGVIPQTISARLARVRELCVEVANSRPEWKYLARLAKH
jgi:hypothetical protein